MIDLTSGMKSCILKNGHLIHRDGRVEKNSALIVKDGVIVTDSRVSADETLPEIECSGCFITPGLVNLHTHSPMNIFRGIAEDARPDRWFNQEIWPYESKMDGDDVDAGAALAVAEMIDNGVTAFADHYFMADRICRIVLESGIRMDIAPTLFGMAGGFEEQLAENEALFREWNGREGRIAVRLGPHSAYTCSPEELKLCAEAAGRLGTGIHIHLEDEEAQIPASLEKYGRTPLAVMADAGLLEHSVIFGHGYWILPEERQLLGSNHWLAVCMKTYMKLGSGPGRVLDKPEELPLAIGTDGAASSNTLSPIEQARLLALAAKYRAADAEVCPLPAVWGMLMRGHDALPFGGGEFSPGAPADFAVWDLEMPHTAPVYNPLAAIIYSSDARNVRHTIVAGGFLKRDGRLVGDAAGLALRAAERASGILKKGKGKTKLVF